MGQKVSCRYETQWGHAALSFRAERSGVEKSPGKQFPVGKKHIGVTLNRKPYAKSFLSVRNTVEPRSVGNYMRKVSCRQETQRCHAE